MDHFKEYLRGITLPMWASCIMALVVGGYLGWRSFTSPDPVLPLLALTAALVGWVVAILATPYSKDEKKRFSEFAKILSGIVTGFLLGKIGPLLDALTAVPAGGGGAPITRPHVAEEVLVTLASFFIALLFVFGGRQYWSPKKRARERPARAKRTRARAG